MKEITNSVLDLTDFYKVDHRRQYPINTSFVYSNFTPRYSRVKDQEFIIFFGLQYFIKKYLIDEFNQHFFQADKESAISYYKNRLDTSLGKDSVTVEHMYALYELGYLPIEIKALPEGSMVPLQVPCLTIYNTHEDFAWVTNWLETLLSCTIWGMCTSATTAFRGRLLFEKYARETGADQGFVLWQGHDFSMRGMFGLEAACISGMAHLISFYGTDTQPAIRSLENYYGADSSKELVGGSVPATEHSVMCAGTEESELETYRRLITQVYPSGIVSIVSDTYDFWNVVTNILPTLKHEIMSRNGKLVIRPDSGDPVMIIAGDPSAPEGSPENKGLIQCLYEEFGGTTNSKGYIVLDPHVGAIYGDSITFDIQNQMLAKLKEKGFASSNIVLGYGSYGYQYVTRDTYGFAIKATYVEIEDNPREIYKKPKTDSSKKSHKGLIKVIHNGRNYEAIYPVNKEEEEKNELKIVFSNSKLIIDQSLNQIRQLIDDNIQLLLTSE